MTDLPRVFIASSTEGLPVAEAVNIKLEKDAEVKLWDNAFDLSSITLLSLIKRARDTDFAVIVFHKDDKSIIRGDTYDVVRDNVLFELGLFIGAVGIDRCFVLIPKSSKDSFRVPTDLAGLTLSEYDDSRDEILDAVATSCAKIKQAIRRLHDKSSVAATPLVTSLPAHENYVPLFYDQSDQGIFSSTVFKLLQSASKVTLIGTGLCILSQDPLRKLLFERAKDKKCKVTIYFGNPYSPDIQNRLIEEEMGDWKPAVGYKGLIKRAEMLLQEKRHCGSPPEISLFMFNHYPTMAIIRIDEHYFTYPYGYTTLGNFSPVCHYLREDPACTATIQYLDRQIEMIEFSASPMEKVLGFFKKDRSDLCDHGVTPSAVYFVPAFDSLWYQFGMKAIGYDVYKGVTISESQHVGHKSEAELYGFHITICDVLYFLNQTDVRRIEEEIRFVSGMVRPFRLSGFKLEKNFPNQGMISIRVQDPSGQLEVLHHELVHRVYSRSCASKYSFKSSKRALGPFSDRDCLMIEKFNAPYILSAFQPHFTLATELNSEQIDDMYNELSSEIKEHQLPDEIEVTSLAIMGLTEDDSHFIIKEQVVFPK